MPPHLGPMSQACPSQEKGAAQNFDFGIQVFWGMPTPYTIRRQNVQKRTKIFFFEKCLRGPSPGPRKMARGGPQSRPIPRPFRTHSAFGKLVRNFPRSMTEG